MNAKLETQKQGPAWIYRRVEFDGHCSDWYCGGFTEQEAVFDAVDRQAIRLSEEFNDTGKTIEAYLSDSV